ncbi:MAG: GNAT family N-acetyltransferase [Saprospiraceae bacterium]|nr:GNAT family N-acetyltransferase [Saprospiraceae bacterium]
MLQTKLIKDKDAIALINDLCFQNEWKKLATQSVGFTQLQEADFLTTWYINYSALFSPVFIFSRNEKNEMVGLIALAWHKEKNYLVHAGNAEYHGWLVKEELTIPFLKEMLNLVRVELNVEKWAWNWMPSGLNAASLKAAASKDICLLVEEQGSPIWQLDNEDKLKKLLKSRSNRSKFNRYKKRGEYYYEIINKPDRIREVLEIARFQCDLRREAMNNSRPFAEDPYKIDFCSELLNFSNKLHVSAMWLDDQLLAFHMGVEDGERVCFGMVSYDPSESKQSPGTLLIIELARHLQESGYKILDMTPGTNSYKDRFANFYETLYRPTFHFSKKSFFKAKVNYFIVATLGKILALGKVDVSTMRKWKTNIGELPSKLKSISPKTIFLSLVHILFQRDIHYLYEIDLNNEEVFSKADLVYSHQKYIDLLDYQGNQPFLTRRDLLIVALEKFAKGDILLSQSKLGKLQSLGWLKEIKGDTKLDGFSETIDFGEKNHLLHDFYLSSEKEAGNIEDNIMSMLYQVKKSGKEKVMLWVKEKDKLSLERLDFLHIKSFRKYLSSSVLVYFKKNTVTDIINS